MEKKAIGLFKKLASKLNRPQTSMVVVYSYGCGLSFCFFWFFSHGSLTGGYQVIRIYRH